MRITRATRKITAAAIAYRVPAEDELNARLSEVLTVIYLLFNEGYLSSAEQAHSHGVVDDAEPGTVALRQGSDRRGGSVRVLRDG